MITFIGSVAWLFGNVEFINAIRLHEQAAVKI